MFRCFIGIGFIGLTLGVSPSLADDPVLADEARGVLRQHCVRCHHGKGSAGGDTDFLSRGGLLADELIKPGKVDDSAILRRIVDGEMPPSGENPRPSVEEVGTLWRWLAAGAPEFPKDTSTRPFVTLESVLTSARDHLRNDKKVDRRDRHNIRFFTLHNLANDPATSDADLRMARAALSKAINSLSRKPAIVIPEAVDPAKTVYAVNIADLDWDRGHLWQAVEREYPYGLTYETFPDQSLSSLEGDLCETSGADLPIIRADWFIATATRPPLYHILLQLPNDARILERDLGVKIAEDFMRPRPDRIARGGFPRSGVSESLCPLRRRSLAVGSKG